MDVLEAIKGRRSCRKFRLEPVDEKDIETILEAATWAPSPLNSQPWEFIVITKNEMKDKVQAEAARCQKYVLEKSGWQWLETYQVDFLETAPVIIAIVGDPKKTGADMFLEEGNMGYQHACAAATQNIHLTAHALGYSTLWFTFFDKKPMREILGIDEKKTPLALVCLGKAVGEPDQLPRKGVESKTTYIK